MKTIQANCGQALPLGRLGENEYTAITFDVSAWLAEYPNAEIQLYNQRPTESASYPISNITVTGGIAKWVVTNTELAKTGQGKCQLAAISGDVIAKSRIFETLVFDALDGGGDVPDPMEDWQQIFVDLKDATEAAAQEAQSSAEAAAASAELAEGYAEQAQAAQSAAEAAQAAKTDAETAAGNAATSATNAANSATQAAQSASAAEAAKDTITGMSVTVQTLPAGSSATASWNNGTLSLGIPRGAQGIQGIQGIQGEQGAQGEKGEKGDTGATGATGAKGDIGATGNGIASVIMNADYTLTITFTDGTEYTTPSIRGAQGEQGIQGEQGAQGIQGVKGETGATGATGNGIASAVLNSDYTLTLTFTDGTSYTTPSIRGAQGEQGIQGVQGVQGEKGETGATGAQGAPGVGVPAGGTTGQVLTKASGDDYDTEWTTVEAGGGTVTDVQVNGASVVEDGVANVPMATLNSVGVVKPHQAYGLSIFDSDGSLRIFPSNSNAVKAGTGGSQPIVPLHQHESTFYGLAKAAGDTTQSASSNAVGTYTDEAKAAIQSMLGISSATTLAGMTDVQITSPYNGQQLIYNSGKWRNQTTFIPTVFERFDIFEDMEGNYGDVGIKYLSVYGNNVPCGADYVLNAGHLCVLTVDGADNSFGCYPLTQILYDGDTAGNYCYIFGNYVFKAYFNDSGTVFVSTDGRVPVDGTTPTITAVNGFSYKCGTVTSLTITPPTNGVCSVRFTSGATPTVLTATGVTFPSGFSVAANTIYDIHISDGLATVNSWAAS